MADAEHSLTKHSKAGGKRKHSMACVTPGFQGSKRLTGRVWVSLPGVSCWRGAVGVPCLACRLDTTSTNAVSSCRHASQCHACHSKPAAETRQHSASDADTVQVPGTVHVGNQAKTEMLLRAIWSSTVCTGGEIT